MHILRRTLNISQFPSELASRFCFICLYLQPEKLLARAIAMDMMPGKG